MFPEILSQSIIKGLVDDFDPERKGVAIEIGVGTDNFYSVKFREAGLKCIAVDPIAWPPFLEIAREHDILFEEACIYDQEQEITLFSSKYSDLSSLNQDWWGVDANNRKKVKAILLKTLLTKYDVDQITFLKADTEGSEYEIIKQLKELDKSQLPYVVEFEYGGGALKHTGAGGWDKKFYDKVLTIIQILQDLNYQQGLIIDSNDTAAEIFDLNTVNDPDTLFKQTYEYGNFLVFKNPVKNKAALENLMLKAQTIELEKTISILNTENTSLRIKVLKLRYFNRFVNKIKRFLGK